MHDRRVGGGWGGSLGVPPFQCFTLFTYYKNSFNETIISVSETTTGEFQVSTGITNIKCFEFYVKTLYRECREIAKKLWLW